MAGKWTDKVSAFTQNAVSKSKELAETTRLNLSISNAEEQIRGLKTEIGSYVVDHQLMTDVPEIQEIYGKLNTLQRSIDESRERIHALKNVNICSNCGAEVSRESRFCDRCGQPIQRPEPYAAEQEAPAQKFSPNCGQALSMDAAFCSNCGAKF